MADRSASFFIATPCPDSPNCVSSIGGNEKNRVAPLAYSGSLAEARGKILEILDGCEHARIVAAEPDFIRAEFASPIFRFVDDVLFYFPPDKKIVHVKSASRVGYYDFGANRKRIERIRRKFENPRK
jgi:uncharacterized protein (DUF1499 family)